MMTRRLHPTQGGAALMEALVAMLVVAFGVLGFVGLQARTAVSTLEGYQRAQALVLLDDIAQRIELNRANAASYAASGIGAADPGACPTAPGKDRDICEWAKLIRGAGEKQGSDSVGAVIGAQGCITDLGGNSYLVALVWRGVQPSGGSPLACGKGGAAFTDEKLRRGVSKVVRIGVLA